MAIRSCRACRTSRATSRRCRTSTWKTSTAQTDVTVVAQLANGKQYTLVGATCKAALEANTRDGQVRVRWEGLWCEEQQLERVVQPSPGIGAPGIGQEGPVFGG